MHLRNFVWLLPSALASGLTPIEDLLSPRELGDLVSIAGRGFADVDTLPRGFVQSAYGGQTHRLQHFKRQPETSEANILVKRLNTDAPATTSWTFVPGTGGAEWTDDQKDWVVGAWNSAKELATSAKAAMDEIVPGTDLWDSAAQLSNELKSECGGFKSSNEKNNCYRTFLASVNLAYGQLFGADPQNVALIQTNFGIIKDNVENLGAANRDNQPLRLTCATSMYDTSDDPSTDLCADNTQAVLLGSGNVKAFSDAGGAQPPANSWTLNFCPAFFKMARMENQLADLNSGGDKNQICSLDNLDSTARCIFHEWTHLPWTLNTNSNNRPKDTYGFRTCASYGTTDADTAPNQPMHTKSFSSKNADSYAWMAVYNHFNNLAQCQGVKYTGLYSDPNAGCTDVWGKTNKWVKSGWNNYPTGND